MNWKTLALVGITLAAGALPGAAADAKAPPKIKVLLITGDDAGAHSWREMAQATRGVLVSSCKFDVRVSEGPLILESAAALQNYDPIFLSYYNSKNQPLTGQAKENLLAFAKGGKGFALSHLFSASFKLILKKLLFRAARTERCVGEAHLRAR